MRLECGCGYVAEGTTEDDVVVAAQSHARGAHRIDLTAQQILAVAYERLGLAADGGRRLVG